MVEHQCFILQPGIRDNTDVAKIQEVTGIENIGKILEAIQACTKDGKYDLESVITLLVGGSKTEMTPDPRPSSKGVSISCDSLVRKIIVFFSAYILLKLFKLTMSQLYI